MTSLNYLNLFVTINLNKTNADLFEQHRLATRIYHIRKALAFITYVGGKVTL